MVRIVPLFVNAAILKFIRQILKYDYLFAIIPIKIMEIMIVEKKKCVIKNINNTQITTNKKMIIKYLRKIHIPKAQPGCLISLKGNIKEVGLKNKTLKNLF